LFGFVSERNEDFFFFFKKKNNIFKVRKNNIKKIFLC
jgi:hypothetical protein